MSVSSRPSTDATSVRNLFGGMDLNIDFGEETADQPNQADRTSFAVERKTA